MGNTATKPQIQGQAYGQIMELNPRTQGLCPVSMRTGKIDDNLLEYLYQDPLFSSCSSLEEFKQNAEQLGFLQNVDHPSIPNHVYFEGYFHGMPTSDPISSMHPRLGVRFDKPAAPLRLRGFLLAFKTANAPWLTKMQKSLSKEVPFKRLMAEDRHFSDLAVQIHLGDAVPTEKVAWHIDAANSILHMAISLRGRRVLWSERAEENQAAAVHRVAEEQVAGDVYISSPYGFMHGLEYVEAEWENRMIAIQFRFLVDREDLFLFKQDDILRTMTAITNALGTGEILIPSLEQVKQAEILLSTQS